MDQPSYEFTNTVADATARVLVRKLNNRDDWLVTAWAAAGNDRTVYVNIPTVGRVGVLASASGSVYRATLTTLMQLTEVGFPDARPGAPTGLRVEQTDSP
jgi:phage baseplate assembly protein gpV